MVIDTNILIACLNADTAAIEALSQWKKEGRALFISSVSTAEVLSLQNLTPNEITAIKSFLTNFIVIPLDNLIADHAATFRRQYRLELPDAIIAATAHFRHVPLVTRDRAFKKVKEITIIEL